MTRSAPRTFALEHSADRAPRHSVQRLVRPRHGVSGFFCESALITNCQKPATAAKIIAPITPFATVWVCQSVLVAKHRGGNGQDNSNAIQKTVSRICAVTCDSEIVQHVE